LKGRHLKLLKWLGAANVSSNPIRRVLSDVTDTGDFQNQSNLYVLELINVTDFENPPHYPPNWILR